MYPTVDSRSKQSTASNSRPSITYKSPSRLRDKLKVHFCYPTATPRGYSLISSVLAYGFCWNFFERSLDIYNSENSEKWNFWKLFFVGYRLRYPMVASWGTPRTSTKNLVEKSKKLRALGPKNGFGYYYRYYPKCRGYPTGYTKSCL